MKFNFLKNAMIALMIVSFTGSMLISCKDKDDDGEKADKTALTALISECEGIINNASTDDYPQSAINAFTTVLNTVKTASEKSGITQIEVDNLVTQLTEAKNIFIAAAYEDIPAAALLIGLSFDEGQGTELTAAGKGLKAVLKKAPAELFGDSKPLPTFVDGKKGKAIQFSEGSHLEIATYSRPDFEGKTLSISVWVKPSATKGPNYIMSYNDWHSWKFQLQDQNKPFFTVNATGGITDADNEADFSAPNGEWTHLVVALDLNNELLTFYVNAEEKKRWDINSKPTLTGTITPNANSWPIIIGAFASYQAAMSDWDGWTTENWNNYFEGAMDEFKVYNIALTQGQVTRLYETEK